MNSYTYVYHRSPASSPYMLWVWCKGVGGILLAAVFCAFEQRKYCFTLFILFSKFIKILHCIFPSYRLLTATAAFHYLYYYTYAPHTYIFVWPVVDMAVSFGYKGLMGRTSLTHRTVLFTFVLQSCLFSDSLLFIYDVMFYHYLLLCGSVN